MKNELKERLLSVSASIKDVLPLLSDNPVDLNLMNMEKKYIIAAMKLYNGCRNDAAEALGITPQTLISKLKKYQIRKQDI